MKQRPKQPPVPSERLHTIRQDIAELLEHASCSAREISSEVGIPEKEVYGHLLHIQKTLAAKGGHLNITPAVCLSCGFVFRKRDRLNSPGRCPVCRNAHIAEPLFSIKPAEHP